MAITLVRPSQILNVPLNHNLPTLYKADNSEVTVANSVAETALWNYTIPAAMMGANDALMIHAGIIGSNTSGGAATFTGRLHLGATSIQLWSISFGSGLTNAPFMIELLLTNTGVTNSQKLISFVTGAGAIQGEVYSTAAVDMTVAEALQLTVQWGTAAATITATGIYMVTEYLKTT